LSGKLNVFFFDLYEYLYEMLLPHLWLSLNTVMIIWLIRGLRIYLHLVGAAGKQGVLFVL